MNLRLLIAATLCAATCAGATSAFADSATSLSAISTVSASGDDDSAAVFAPVKLTAVQSTAGNADLAAPSASVGADVLRGATGNAGVNLVAGAFNVQANQIALVGTSRAEIVSQQTVQGTAHMTGSGTAALGAGALANVSGNIGINIAAGAGNAQYNGMVVH
ncbi:MAG: hypothetical protein V4793_24140 [Paraburkholderia tropica]|uniref:Adhesin n=1 Tax=Paraburkholderia tropica TaxID=92647 RepID=A0ABX5MNE6_9BURK|nr:hypothetical protein [Paraburkholderia tropica]MDE1144858.1 hypothetical protein [Paraburkholderia tropica]PXX15750.1 hypothetical protein C7400_10985 [Paraburkholderia tropica]PZW82009.1 hypothetical protein C7399_10985 [Paraburkholderia tropica]